jgi:hypothetical protein
MEQVIKLTGLISEVMPVQSGVSPRTGNSWRSQDILFDFHEWSGAIFTNRILCRVNGENIEKFDLHEGEKDVTLTLRLGANKSKDGRWFNEIRITGVERPVEEEPQPTVKVEEQAAPAPEAQQQQKADDLPF